MASISTLARIILIKGFYKEVPTFFEVTFMIILFKEVPTNTYTFNGYLTVKIISKR